MGVYLNPGADNFIEARKSKIYVDKSGIISYLNSVAGTTQKYVCVSRPRRFGKSMAADMISAYYDRTTEAKELFSGLGIEQDESFEEYANKYDVIALNMQEFLSNSDTMEELLALLKKSVLWDLKDEYPNVRYFDGKNLSRSMRDVFAATRRKFVILIDEWDCIFREYRERKDDQEKYLDFLRDWLKDKSYIALAYMTGILPIKKYGTHSALNMFAEYSMINAGGIAKYTGFTEGEVKSLCEKYHMSFDETKAWYDGYRLEQTIEQPKDGKRTEIIEIYSPRSVVSSMIEGKFAPYWNQTESFEALRIYIDMNFDGLRDDIIAMMSGESKKIDIRSFTNDMVTLNTADDVMTLLVHLGYLGYDSRSESVFIPNHEIMREYVTATATSRWSEIINSVKKSDELLTATWAMDAARVAEGIENAHFETSHIQYNDENALSYTLSLAYYAARQYYTMIREMPAGNGFADIIYVPRRKYADKPAMIAELKWNKDADTAIRQIKEKKYVKALDGYVGDVLLIGIDYDKKTRKHECKIEKLTI